MPRLLYPIVLGLGGWFLGALIVLTAMPGVPLDNALLAVLSVGVPVGLGIYPAWVPGDWTGARLAAATAGARDASDRGSDAEAAGIA